MINNQVLLNYQLASTTLSPIELQSLCDLLANDLSTQSLTKDKAYQSEVEAITSSEHRERLKYHLSKGYSIKTFYQTLL
jgi:hypothetical protein